MGFAQEHFLTTGSLFMTAYLTRMEGHVAGMTGTGHAPFAANFLAIFKHFN